MYVCVGLTIQAVLQMSAGVLYPAPINTSMERYCLVWMSSVKCLCWTKMSRHRTTVINEVAEVPSLGYNLTDSSDLHNQKHRQLL